MSQALMDYYHSVGDDPFECGHAGCDQPAVFFVEGWSCEGSCFGARVPLKPEGQGCGHAHEIPCPMCETHALGRESEGLRIVGTTGD